MTRKIDPIMVEALLSEIGNKFFSVTFEKKDGTLKTIARARLNVTSRMADNGQTGTNEKSDAARATLAKHNLIPVVDLDAPEGKGWRSFKVESVVSIKFGGNEITA
jgi:hypothetical protein